MVRNNDIYMHTLQKALTNMSNHLLFKNIPYYMIRYNACRWPPPGCKQLQEFNNDCDHALWHSHSIYIKLRICCTGYAFVTRALAVVALQAMFGPTSASHSLPATHDTIQVHRGSLYCPEWVRGLTFKWRSSMKFILAVTASSKQVSACKQKGAGGAA
jgi:hypothetical protein